VKFRLHESVIKPENVFILIKQAMEEHWNIVKDMPFGAEFTSDNTYAEYITCCDNVWAVTKTPDTVYLEYEGSRTGFYAQTIFDEKIKFIPIVAWGNEELHMLVKQEHDYERIAVFKLVEYRTTTPKEWNIKWYHVIIPVQDKKYAVVIDPTVTTTFYKLCIVKIVPYRKVYNS